MSNECKGAGKERFKRFIGLVEVQGQIKKTVEQLTLSTVSILAQTVQELWHFGCNLNFHLHLTLVTEYVIHHT